MWKNMGPSKNAYKAVFYYIGFIAIKMPIGTDPVTDKAKTVLSN
jgi:hypothetical protein